MVNWVYSSRENNFDKFLIELLRKEVFTVFITVYFESADLGGGVLEVGAAGELAADVVLGAGGLLGPGLGGAGAGEGVGAGAEVAGPRAGVAHLPLGVKPQLVVTRYHHLVLVRQLKHWCLLSLLDKRYILNIQPGCSQNHKSRNI